MPLLTRWQRTEQPDPDPSPDESKRRLSYHQLRRMVATLNTARRDYQRDGNAARRFFESGAIDDLVIELGLLLPQNERHA